MSDPGTSPSVASQAALDRSLVELAARCAHDPLAFVKVAFDWGRGELTDHPGPDRWQAAVLQDIAKGLLNLSEAIRISVASGHGVGKSALTSWLILWAMVTSADCRGVVTANTENQLRTKTWAELAKWHRLCLWAPWFELTATALFSSDPQHSKTWRCDSVPWSLNSVESFAGLHNQGRRVLLIFDEASAIPDQIWETAQGALTDKATEIVWCCFGNPTRASGRFRECFGRYRHRWITHQVDGREVRITNKTQIQQWSDDYGTDSDFFKVRVRGEFPKAGTLQFISSELVEEARLREPQATLYDPVVLGADIARFGDDQTVIVIRRGRDAQTIPWVKLRGADTMHVAARIVELVREYRPDAVFVDGGGLGAGVIDRLRMLRQPVVEVNFGASADNAMTTSDGAVCYANKRAEMWGRMRDWLRGGSIPDDPELLADLCGVEFGYSSLRGRDSILLEKKQDMKRRGLASPDAADALALTFAQVVMPSDHRDAFMRRPQHLFEYDPLARELARGTRQSTHVSDYDPMRMR